MKKRNALMAIAMLVIIIACNLPGITPTIVPTQAPSTVRGLIWHEACKFTGGEGGEPVVLGQGCIQWGTAAEEFGPNQLKDDFETGWDGVTIHLGSGACPSSGLASTKTNTAGEYQFAGLAAGKYCVSYSNLSDGNDTILIPGEPTFPARGDSGFYATIDLAAAQVKTVNFGYAWQFYN
jgi:hypothetical protein